jgi:hypothetical protein
MAGESIGWGGEFHLHNSTSLQTLENVTSVTPPEDMADEHEVTHLKSPGRRKEFIAGMIDGGEITVEINHVPNSATDQLCLAAKAAADTRAWKIVFPATDGTALRQYTGNGFVKSYKVNPVVPNEPMTSTMVIRCSGAVTEAAAA